MEYDDLQLRYFDTLESVQALLDMITKREMEMNEVYKRVEHLEKELEKRDKIIGVLKKYDRGYDRSRIPSMTGLRNTGGPSALIVDAVSRMRLVLKEIITSAGYIVIGEADDINGSVSMATHGKPDLVILNAKLGKENGFDALREMRKVLPELKAIIITDGPDPLAVLAALEQGVADIIPKPISRLRLHELAKSLATHP